MNGSSGREYLKVIYERYRQAGLQEKQAILNEFCRNTGYHRKYAIPLLNGPRPDTLSNITAYILQIQRVRVSVMFITFGGPQAHEALERRRGDVGPMRPVTAPG